MTVLVDLNLDGLASSRRRTAISSTQALAGGAIGLALLRLFMAAHTGLTNDEAYYRLWSLAPSLSYFDHPPMVAWLMALGRFLVGDTELGVRFLAPLLLAIGSLIHWRSALRLNDRKTSLYAGWFFLAMPLMAIGGVVLTPDLPSVLFYGLVLLSIGELDRSQNANWWLATGLFAGCGLLSKYTNLFAGAAILIWLLAVPGNRKWFSCPQLWIGGAIAAALFSPVLVWNAQHDWASFSKQFGRVTTGDIFGFQFSADLLGCFLGLASPVIAVLALLGLGHVLRRAIRERTSNDVLLAAAIVPMLGYFMAHALHSRVMPNWPAPLYPLLATCAAIGLRIWIPAQRQAAIGIVAIGLGLLSTGIVYMHANRALVHMEKDPTGEMRGWPQFYRAIDALSTNHGSSWLVTSSFQTSAQLSFAFKGQLPVVQLGEQIRYENLPPVADEILAKPALYVDLERNSHQDALRDCFAGVDLLATVKRLDGTHNGADYAVYQLTGLRPSCRPEHGLHAETSARQSPASIFR